MNTNIKLTFVGDIMCQKEQSQAAWNRHGSYKYDDTFSNIKNIFNESDYTIGNLETPVASESLLYTCNTFRFNTPPTFLASLKSAGFDLLSTANNHCLDRGIQGLTETLQNLQDQRIESTGTYLTREESEEIFVRTIGGLNIAFIACTYGTNSEYYGSTLTPDEEWRVDLLRNSPPKTDPTLTGTKKQRLRERIIPVRFRIAISALRGKVHRNPPPYISDNVFPEEASTNLNKPYLERLSAKIRRARESADLVIVMPHIGGQYNPTPGLYSKFIMNWLLKQDVDCVIANHPHVPLRCEKFDKHRFGAFSLGNFISNPSDGCLIENQLSDYGVILNLYISKNSKKIERVGFHVVKTIVEKDGYATIHNINKLIDSEKDQQVRERLIIETEAVVNRFRGTADSVEPSTEYNLNL